MPLRGRSRRPPLLSAQLYRSRWADLPFMSFPGHYECIKELVWGAFQPNDLSRQFTTPCLESRQQTQQANIATPSCNCFSVVADRLWMWWRSSRTGCGCGGGCHRQAVDVVEVVTDRVWWRLSRTGYGCGGGRHRQDVNVVEVVTQRNYIMDAEVANPYPLHRGVLKCQTTNYHLPADGSGL